MCMGLDWNGKHWIRDEKRLAIHMRDAFMCMYCGRDMRSCEPNELTLDHLIPRSEGGGNDATNLVTACKRCNSSRGLRSYVKFAPGGSLDRIETTRLLPLNVRLAKAILSGEAGDPRLEALR